MHQKIKPVKIRLEASSLCQLRCPCCTTASREIEKGVGFGYLKCINFKKVIEENPFIREVEISNFGEIFLNPELSDIIRYAYEKHVRMTADNGVNLNTVTDEVLEKLVIHQFSRLSVSIDGASQKTYQKYRKKGDFSTVIDNIRKINDFKKKYRSRYPKLAWQFVIFGHNEHEIPAARKMAADLDMSFHPKLSWDPEYSPVKDYEFVKRETGLSAADRNDYKEKTGRNYVSMLCHQLWEEPQINWDGRILGCCWNYWSDFGGNAFEDGLLPTLNSEKIDYAREMLIGKKPARDDLPCATCDLCKEMNRDGTWLKRGFSRSLYITAKYFYHLK